MSDSASMEAVMDQAIAWHVRLADATLDEWEAFTAWLEAAPANTEAYDVVALCDASLGGALLAPATPPMRAMNDNTPGLFGRVGKWVPAMTALAAALVAAVVIDPLAIRHAPYTLETAAGESRTVTIGDGTRIAMNGGTRLTLDRRDARVATLDRGQATFTVTHDAAHPFELRTGDATLRDVGTVFDVVADDHGTLKVSVAEGAVLYNPNAEALLLRAGAKLDTANGAGRVGQVDPASVGAWRDGRLVYRDAPIGEIAADLTRATGAHIDVAPEIAARRFTGVILIDRDSQRLMERLKGLLDVGVQARGDNWRFTPSPRVAS